MVKKKSTKPKKTPKKDQPSSQGPNLKEYQKDTNKCPYCGEKPLYTSSELEEIDNEVRQKLNCGSCGNYFMVIWHVARIDLLGTDRTDTMDYDLDTDLLKITIFNEDGDIANLIYLPSEEKVLITSILPHFKEVLIPRDLEWFLKNEFEYRIFAETPMHYGRKKEHWLKKLKIKPFFYKIRGKYTGQVFNFVMEDEGDPSVGISPSGYDIDVTLDKDGTLQVFTAGIIDEGEWPTDDIAELKSALRPEDLEISIEEFLDDKYHDMTIWALRTWKERNDQEIPDFPDSDFSDSKLNIINPKFTPYKILMIKSSQEIEKMDQNEKEKYLNEETEIYPSWSKYKPESTKEFVLINKEINSELFLLELLSDELIDEHNGYKYLIKNRYMNGAGAYRTKEGLDRFLGYTNLKMVKAEHSLFSDKKRVIYYKLEGTYAIYYYQGHFQLLDEFAKKNKLKSFKLLENGNFVKAYHDNKGNIHVLNINYPHIQYNYFWE